MKNGDYLPDGIGGEQRVDGILALRVLLTADGESAALEMTVRGA